MLRFVAGRWFSREDRGISGGGESRGEVERHDCSTGGNGGNGGFFQPAFERSTISFLCFLRCLLLVFYGQGRDRWDHSRFLFDLPFVDFTRKPVINRSSTTSKESSGW